MAESQASVGNSCEDSTKLFAFRPFCKGKWITVRLRVYLQQPVKSSFVGLKEHKMYIVTVKSVRDMEQNGA